MAIQVAGSPPPAKVIAEMEGLGFDVLHVYGMTELQGPSTLSAPQEAWSKLSPGERANKMALQGVRYQVVDGQIVGDPKTCKPVPKDGVTIGEVLMQGNTVMLGYLKDPKATAAAFRGGWMHTGDLAVWDESNYIEIKDRMKQIMDLIKAVVDTNTWEADSNGDDQNDSRMEQFDSKLIITALPETHRHIADLLSDIRQVQALEISLETRVLTISTDWFEQIGIDFDMYFNTNSAMYSQARQADPNFQLKDFFFNKQNGPTSKDAGKLKNPLVFGGIAGSSNANANATATGGAYGVQGTTPGQVTYQQNLPVGTPITTLRAGDTYPNGEKSTGFAPVQVQQEGLPLTDDLAFAGMSSAVGKLALLNPVMTVGMTFLDDVQVDLLVQSTQADQRNAILTAPRLTLLNGQQSALAVGRVINYVSGYTQGTGNTTGVPIVTPFNSGISLTLEAVASADRRYVTVTVQFQQQDFEGFDDQRSQQAV
ncbi:MAG: hypothetical protein EBU31_14390, partial [Proteobacteria bacterium]|nr:hypothetical protein [Pseudomonadota bacterium]